MPSQNAGADVAIETAVMQRPLSKKIALIVDRPALTHRRIFQMMAIEPLLQTDGRFDLRSRKFLNQEIRRHHPWRIHDEIFGIAGDNNIHLTI